MTHTHRLGLIGDPVAHSLSPAIQGAALAALGIDATYELWPTPAAELPRRLVSLRAPDVLGANVTVPHKLAVMDDLDEVTPLAWRAGAVNTIVHRDGRLWGDNTDIHGFSTSLLAACPDAPNRPALILGAGGAARAVVLALESIGSPRITVANRHPARAERLTADLAPTPIRLANADDASLRPELAEAAIFVNATSLGWHTGETPLALDQLDVLPPDCFVVDLTYRETDLLAAARDYGLGALDGLPMLVHQGAKAFELWTEQTAPIDIMLAAATRARDARATPNRALSTQTGGAVLPSVGEDS